MPPPLWFSEIKQDQGNRARRQALPAFGGVVPRVEQDVAKGVTYLAWSLEAAGVVTLGEQLARALEVAVEATGQSRAERLHGGREVAAGVGLDEEMDVIAQDTVVDDAEGVRVAKRDEIANEGDRGAARPPVAQRRAARNSSCAGAAGRR